MTRRIAPLLCFGVSVLVSLVFSVPAHAQDSWTVAGNMSTTRVFGQVTPLLDGRVLITGGAPGAPQFFGTRTVDIFDPATGVTTPGPLMHQARWHHGAARLPDGRVLVMGGNDLSLAVALASAEIFDPVSNSWSIAAPMAVAKGEDPQVVVLPSGKVLVAGGYVVAGTRVTLVELFDPASNTWASIGPITQKWYSGATRLKDGRAMVVFGGTIPASELYDQATNSWSAPVPLVNGPGFNEYLVTLADGRVAHLGAGATVQLYDPGTDAWTAGTQAPLYQRHAGMALLRDGRIMVAGGFSALFPPDSTVSQIYDPVTDTWSEGPPMNEPHTPRLARLVDGRILAAGSFFGSPNSRAIELYGIANNAPTAHAGADVSATTCDTCLVSIRVDASGSSDPDGDQLLYTWSAGATILSSSTSPIADLPVAPDVSVLTLTVSDPGGREDTDSINVSLFNVEDEYRVEVSSLQSSVAGLTLSLGICEANTGASQQAVNALEAFLQGQFSKPGFEIPGATTQQQLENLVNAITQLNHGQQQALLKKLGGN